MTFFSVTLYSQILTWIFLSPFSSSLFFFPLLFPSMLRSNPFFEPKTSSPARTPAGGPSPDVGSSQKRRAPQPPGPSPGLGLSPPAPKPSPGADREKTQPVGPSPVAAVLGRELASSSPKVNRLLLDLHKEMYKEKKKKKKTDTSYILMWFP